MANESEQALFDDCLSVDLPLAVSWQPGAVVDAARQQRVLRQLQLVQGFEESRGDIVEDGSGAQMEASLQRIEQKLDFTLELLGSLLARDTRALRMVNVRLSTRGLCADLGAEAGSRGVVEFRLHALITEPLEIAARVIDVTGEGHSYIGFEEAGPGLSAALERLVFRWHRKAIAATRKS